MKAHSICHAGLTVSDFEASVRWYHETFGFLLISEDTLEPSATRALFPLYGVDGARVRMGFLRAPGGSVLELFEFSPKAEKRDAVWNAPGFTHLAMNVTNVSRWHERLRSGGADFVTPPQRTGSVDWVFMRDPDGNLVELIDMKALRVAIGLIGGALGTLLKRGKYSKYYKGE
ncbi:MAG: glyoxalase/bleomycin resistance/dioxygenase family protein [Spirochaetae bacterium HGW-Spirochaetae-3]|jgi:catechol 2,3-dioxygenase-like lactoylglutathione lyase family enzyme|nr:MAG: glyoxalase/bleomycin resistance/dioxygenase family protein [Spirochaetae bacterium HGW-Spirochaetae-3]